MGQEAFLRQESLTTNLNLRCKPRTDFTYQQGGNQNILKLKTNYCNFEPQRTKEPGIKKDQNGLCQQFQSNQ